jgi:undecaprenyl diphosphate synthase
MEKTAGIPRHVAIIMDGNGRWAEQHGLSRLEGHRAGVRNMRPVLERLNARGVAFVTIYAFSTENWNRPRDEVNGLLEILLDVIDTEARELHKNGVRILHIGSPEGLSKDLQRKIRQAVKLTEGNKGMTLGVAFNYGGRAEILEAVRRLIADGAEPEDIAEENFGRYLYTHGFPDVDLMIRTSGEMRTSNFLIWQAAYAELYFTPVLWPDFDAAEVDRALEAYGRRQRRFGGLG